MAKVIKESDPLQRIYLDHNATTPLRQSARDKMLEVMNVCGGNPSSTHTAGRQARSVIEEARDQVAELLGVPAREIVFTSGGTESDNLAIFAMNEMASRTLNAHSNSQVRGSTSLIEHSAVRDAAKVLEEKGHGIHWIEPSLNGEIELEEFRRALAQNPHWISVHWANNETGVVQPVLRMAEEAKAQGALFHSDAVQALGRVDLDISKFAGDMISVSSHKIGGPKGVGALWIRNAEAIPARLFGGAQEREIRPGTENLYGIAGFGAAARETLFRQECEREEQRELRDYFEGVLKEKLKDIHIHGQEVLRLPNTSSILFPQKTADLMLMGLDLRGYDLSAGSACSSGSVRFSPVIKAMGYSEGEAASTLRVSLGRGNQKKDLDKFIEALVDVYKL